MTSRNGRQLDAVMLTGAQDPKHRLAVPVASVLLDHRRNLLLGVRVRPPERRDPSFLGRDLLADREDEPVLAEELRVEAIDLGYGYVSLARLPSKSRTSARSMRVLAWRGGELGTPPHWEGASLPPTPPAPAQTPNVSDATKLSVRIGVFRAVPPADGVPLSVAAFRARRQAVDRAHVDLIAAVRAAIRPGRHVASGWNWIRHLSHLLVVSRILSPAGKVLKPIPRCTSTRTPNNSLTDPVSAAYPDDVLFYGVVSAQTEKVVEFFLEREAAEAMIREVREDEPELEVDLRIEGVELG